MRTFTTTDLVQLPRLEASGAQTLAQQVIATAGREPKLPPAVEEVLSELGLALRKLTEASGKSLRAVGATDGALAKAADVKIDACWAGLYGWLQAWAKVPGIGEATVAAAIGDQLFTDGLKFTQLRYRLEWAESNTRLNVIKADKLDHKIDALGGAKILKALREAHKEYGEVLGITAGSVEDTTPSGVRDALSEVTASLREFVVQVSASTRRNNPKSMALGARLLAPIGEWESPAQQSGAVTPAPTDPVQAPSAPAAPAGSSPVAAPVTTTGKVI